MSGHSKWSEIKRAKGVDDLRRREAALQASRRMVARGEHPLFRVTAELDGDGSIVVRCVDFPWIVTETTARRDVLDEARRAIAAWLDVNPAGILVELASP